MYLLTLPIVNNSGILSEESYSFDTNCGAQATQILNPGIVPRENSRNSHATEVVDSHPVDKVCGAQATQETKQKSNPFVTDGNVPAILDSPPKGILQKPSSLERFVAIIMSHTGEISDPKLNKN